jgi:peptidoglycan-associated lipoprotein
MTIHRGSRWLGPAVACALLVACHHKQPPATPAPSPQPAPPVVSGTAPPPPQRVTPPEAPRVPAPAAPTEEEIFARTSLADLNAKEPLDDTFFAYDRSELSEPSRTSLERDATWMRKWNRTRVLIEGHADERGTSEYNLALGERRAAATRDYLVSLGIDLSRINIVSKGKEAPFCTEHNETCWRMNRRGHFIITAK